MKQLKDFCTLLLIMVVGPWIHAQVQYQTPPDVIANLVLAKPTPSVSLSPDGEYMLLMQSDGYPKLEELAKEELRIGGLRIDPANHGQSRSSTYSSLSVQRLGSTNSTVITGLPENPRIDDVSWSQTGEHIAFTLDEGSGISLWIADLESAEAHRITGPVLNGALRGAPFAWIAQGEQIMYKVRLPDSEKPGLAAKLPEGPVVQESSGQDAAIRTYQDLLQDPQDEALFEYYATCDLYKYDLDSGQSVKWASDMMVRDFSESPDGEYFLVTTMHRPFSYLVPYYRFPMHYTVYNKGGQVVKQLAKIPLAEEIPKGFDATRTGVRSVTWRADADAQLYWAEAVDNGDPSRDVEHRDYVYSLSAPFDNDKTLEAKCEMRFRGLTFGTDELAILYEGMWSDRMTRTNTFTPGDPESVEVLFERSSEDRYSDPGSFVTESTPAGDQVLLIDDGYVYLSGSGASPEGDRPFVRKMSLSTGEQSELWRSEAPYYERAVSFDFIDEGKLITRRESKDEQPNYYMLDISSGQREPLTAFEHPYPELLGISKQEVAFKRADGIDLTGDLYLPKGYDAEKDGPLPTLMWAYPREYKSAAAAGQVSGSPYSFIRVYYGSPIFWATRGYAVLANASMPIVGEGDKEPNDSFRQQLVMNAEAAIDHLAEMGVCDRNRVAIGGHSYGAFMTANLLAHSDLFAAGIARSGAYNRTLTPFGFQREERTYWDDPDIYYTMSPFMHADKVNEPILLIHGEADNNSGTFPMQSKRFYSAIKGLGGTARLVMLPYESHGYRAQESILHMLWEQDQWLEKYVKNKAEPSGKS